MSTREEIKVETRTVEVKTGLNFLVCDFCDGEQAMPEYEPRKMKHRAPGWSTFVVEPLNPNTDECIVIPNWHHCCPACLHKLGPPKRSAVT